MASQRKAGKKKVQVWLDAREIQSLKDQAKKKGLTVTEFLKQVQV